MHKKILGAAVLFLVIGLISLRFLNRAAPVPQKIEEGCTVIPFKGPKLEPGYLSLDVRGGAVCHFVINKNLPMYTFRLRGSVKENSFDQIEVSRGDGNSSVSQTLDAYMTESPLSTQEYFLADQDINFDGYKDIRLLTWWGATGNAGYTYWLFDPNEKRFVLNNELSALSNPTPDYQSKTILTSSNGGMAGCIYYAEKYQFDNAGKLALISTTKQDLVDPNDFAVPESFVKTISELKDGKMATRTVAGKCPGF